MPKQYNVDLRFNADTTQAKKAITDLEQSLQKLGHSSMPKNSGIDPADFEKASAAARELEFHLKNAYNVKTGNLDLSKLDQSLKSSNTSLSDLTSGFSRAGATGQQAFVNLAKAIASADQPSLTLNTHLSTMWTTLKNVARFQLSSSIMHGLIGGIQSAYGYAQDLNESLNNIRIVTGQSTEQMARFAEQANKGARALSTTTLDYTDAALIYYQQGLSNEEVVARTETTLKLANVSRQSAEEVSNQMTAIWNNFVDGSHNLEYYADVITALGAATASSSQEIAGGLEKFASVAQTVGLSYEYATSALATIVAITRQSEDTVGTGLRTLFARFEGLKLGETLEDGVDLNKYSKALQTIGVNVLDANGNLKDMDEILDQMGEKWDTLNKAQQVALAQTVGGVRQYTNLVALMDNWDFFKENLEVASGAEGTLQQQADIYAESWEAARDRVRAAAESIFQALLDDKFFIGITNFIEKLLVGIRTFIDSFGGLKGLLYPILGFAFSMLSTKIGPAIEKVIQDIKILSGHSKDIYQAQQRNTTKLINAELSRKKVDPVSGEQTQESLYTNESQASLNGSKDLLAAKTQLSAVEDKLSAAEKMRAQIAISGIEAQIKQNENLGKELDDLKKKEQELTDQAEREKKLSLQKTKEEIAALKEKKENIKQSETDLIKDSEKAARNNVSQAFGQSFQNYSVNIDGPNSDQIIGEFKDIKDFSADIGELLARGLTSAFEAGESGADNFKQILNTILTDSGFDEEMAKLKIPENSGQSVEELAEAVHQAQGKLSIFKSTFGDLVNMADTPQLANAFKKALSASTPEEFNQALNDVITNLGELENSGIDVESALKKMGIPPKTIGTVKKLRKELADLEKEEARLKAIEKEEGVVSEETKQKQIQNAEARKKKQDEITAAIKRTNEEAKNLNFSHIMSGTEVFSTITSGLMQVGTTINSVRSLINAWNNDDLTFGEKVTQSLMAISMGASGVMSIISSVSKMNQSLSAIIAADALKVGQAKAFEAGMSALSQGAQTKENAEKLKGIVTSSGYAAAMEKEGDERTKAVAAMLVEKLGLTEEEALKVAGMMTSAGAAGAKEVETKSRWKHVASIIAEKVAQLAANPVLLIAIAIITALAVAIAVLIHNRNKDAEAAKQAAEDQKQATKAYEDAKAAYKELMETISSYKDAEEAISHLTKGTQEWKDAVTELNEQVLDLIQKYPKLADYVDDSGDYLKITQEGLEYLEQTGQRQLDMARQNQLMATIRSNDAKNNASYTSVGEGIRYAKQSNGHSYASNSVMRKAVKAYNDSNGNLTEDALRAVGITDPQLIHALLENKNEIKNLSKEINANTKANGLLTKQMVESTLQNVEGFDAEGEFSDEVAEALASQAEEYAEAHRSDWESDSDVGVSWDINGEKDVNYGRMSDEEMHRRYAELMGWDVDSIDNGSGTGTFHFSDGTQRQIDDTAMRYALNYAAYMQTLGESANDVAESFNNLASAGNEVSQGLGSMLVGFAGGDGGDFKDATTQQMQDFSKLGSVNDEGKFILDTDDDRVQEILANWKALGYKSEEAYREALQNAYDQYQHEESELTKGMAQNVEEAYNSIDLGEATLAQKQKVSEALKKIYMELGTEGTELLTTVLNKAITDGIDPDIIIDALNQVDWTAPDAMGQLQTILDGYGVEIDLSDPSWVLLINRMREAERTAASLLGRLEALRGALKDVGDIAGKIEFGTIISDEDYEKLVKYNSAVAGLFTMTAGGWQFIGDTDRLNQLLATTGEDIDEIKESFEAANRAGRHLANEDKGTDDDDNKDWNIDFTTGKWISGEHEGEKISDTAKSDVLQRLSTKDYFDTILSEAQVDEDAFNTALEAYQNAISNPEYADDDGNFDWNKWAEENAANAEIISKVWTEAGNLQQGYLDGTYESIHAEELYINACVASVSELNGLLEEGKISAEAYNKTLESVAKKETENLGLDWDTVQTQAQLTMMAAMNGELEGYQKGIGMSEAAAYQLAIRNAQVDRGLQSMTQNLSKWTNVLRNGSKTSTEYAEAINEMSTAVADLIGFKDKDLIPVSFYDLPNALELIEKAATGSKKAIQELGIAVARESIKNLELSQTAQEYLETYGQETDQGISWADGASQEAYEALLAFDNYKSTVLNGLQAIQDAAEGASLADALGSQEMADEWINALNEMAKATGMSKEQMQSYLNSMGVDATVVTDMVDVNTTVPIYETREEKMPSVIEDGHEYRVTQTHTKIVGYQPVTEKMEVAQINMGDDASTPTIRRAGGSGSARIANGGGGGGGGGGSNKSKEKKNPTDEKDRYHTITEKIQDATDAYDKLSKAQDRAFGKERIKAMEGITNNLHLQIELQKQYLDEIRNYLEGDRAAVEALGATFDANGVITNYDDLIAELVAKYNEGVDAFNNGGLDEDAFKEQYEEPFNDAKDAIDQYVETINLLQSEELNLIDQQNELADQLREIAAYKLELHIDIDEDELQYLDFLLNMLGENAEDAVDRLDLLGQQFNTNRDEIAAYTTAIQDLLRLRGFTDEDVAAFIRGELTAGDLEKRGFTTDDIDKLREYRDAIQDNTTAMNDLAKEIEESFLNTLDDLNDKVDSAEERFDHFATMLEHFHNVVDIVGQDALGMSAETMKLLAKATKENAIEMVKAAKTQLDSLNAVRAQAQAQLDAALEAQKNASTAEEKLRAEEAVRYWSDTISEVTNRVEQAEEDLADALENALEGIQEMYTTMIEQATKEFERSVTGAAGSLEQLQNNFDRQKETQELYIPTYEKIYELTKLTRDINNSIDDTDNLWSKQELAKLQDEINQKMEDGVELTEHDVEELRKRYELKLAEAALEEAQDAKRTVRMSRDNEGNWSYVYTADENDVAAAEQSYEDKLYEYQQMNYEYIQELQGNIIQAEQDMTDQINDLDITKFASKEAYLAEVQRIMDATQAKEQQYKDQLAQTLDQQGILYEEDWKRYNELTGYRMARDDQWVDNWNETILAQQTGFETLEEMFDQLTGAIGGPDEPGTYVGDITDAYAEMQASNERALNAAGTSMQTYEQDTVDAISGIDQQMEETQNQVEEFANSMADAMEGVSDFIGEWKNQYGEAVKSITEFNKDLYDSCNTLIKKLQDTYGVNADFEAAQAQAAAEALAGGNRESSSEGGSSGGDPSSNNHYDPPQKKVRSSKTIYEPGIGNTPGTHKHYWHIEYQYDDETTGSGPQQGPVGNVVPGGAGMVCTICGRMWAKSSQNQNSWISLKSGGYTGIWSAVSGRTGMYTGSWNGPDLEENGRLAFLHQKELVLNASDTENFLSAVDMVRQISQTIDLQAASRSNGWNFLLPGVLSKEPDTLDQNVHIEAHFPNVTSHSEIEEAFTNLVGKASQFANR